MCECDYEKIGISRRRGPKLFFALLYLLLHATNSMGADQPVTQILDTMFAQYDKAIRPYYGEKPVDVSISIYVLSVQELSESNMDFTVMMYLRQSWTDPRLVFRPNRGINRNGSNNTIYIDENRAKSLWIPDTFVVNEKKTLRHAETSVNEFVRVNSSGSVLKSTRYTMTLTCPMDLQLFPFDRQTCTIDLESFAATMSDIRFQLVNDSIGVSNEVSLPGFSYVGYSARTIELNLSTGNYSRAALQFVFQRSFAYYLLRCYIPIGAAVTVSLLSLILANSVVGPIIHVVNMCFVTWYSAQAWMLKGPMISYTKYLDLYFFICIAHLSLCLIVSLAASYRQRNQEATASTVCNICKPLTELDAYRGNQSHNQRRKESSCNGNTIICCSLKFIIVALFVLSNVGYWLWIRYATRRVEKQDEYLVTPKLGY